MRVPRKEPRRLLPLSLMIALLAAGVPTAYGQSFPGEALRDAVSKGHRLGSEQRGADAVRQLLDAGVSVNAQDSVGWTALMQCGLEGLPAVAEVLVRAGADVNLRSNRGDTALMVAVVCTIVRTRAGLVAVRGLPPSMKQEQLDPPLRLARLLIAKGANVDAARQDGRTVLMSAVMVGWREIVQVLLENRVDVHARDKEGSAAMDYAQPVRDPEIVEMLRQGGSKSPATRSGRRICDAQDRLGELGYDADSRDCWWGWGSTTRGALRRFQQDHALPVTGQLDEATIKALGLRH